MVEQRSKEWFKQRVGKITGSRVGAILGLSPFKKPSDVMREMVREYHGAESEFEGNIATNYGTTNENTAIFDFELETGLTVVETGLHVHPEYDWLAASPDGFIGDDAVCEIKCPYGKRDSDDFNSLVDQSHYFAQVQIEMACTSRGKNYFFQWSPMGTRLEIIDFSKVWFNENLSKLKKFYDQYLLEIEKPEKHIAPLIKNKEAEKEAQRFVDAKAAFDKAKAEMDEAKANLIKIANGEKSNISGLLVYPIEKSGSISYSKVVKDLLPDADLEKYRGKPSKSWGVR